MTTADITTAPVSGAWLTRVVANARRYAMPLIFAVLAVLIIGLLMFTWQNSRRATSDAVTPEQQAIILGKAPPPVEPVILKAVPQDVARKVNSQTAFTDEAVPPARPFQIFGDGASVERATDCLASAIYYEAANEAIEGQRAVAQVVLNRVRHPAYPKSVCGVVYQGQERRTGCQFSFSCDGSMRRVPSPEFWSRMRGLARSMLAGQVYAPVGWATHYHTDWVLPAWSAKLDKIRAERTHLFFRWTGFWGTPKAFRGGYTGAEPNVAKLGGLSRAHIGVDPLINGVVLPSEITGGVIPGALQTTEGANGEFILRIDRSADPALLPELAARTCGTRDYCKLLAFAGSSAVPKSFTMGDAQLSAAAFSYLRNRDQGFEKPLWNCTLFPRADRRQCMRRRIVIEGKAQELIPSTDLNPELPATRIPVPSADTAETTAKPIDKIPELTVRRRPGSGANN